MSEWQRRKILVWGKTRPEVSRHYRETVCTGGIFEDTCRLVRLYPIPLRYLDDKRYFQKYQWITADVQRAVDSTWSCSYAKVELPSRSPIRETMATSLPRS
jgi:hypothetical protein